MGSPSGCDYSRRSCEARSLQAAALLVPIAVILGGGFGLLASPAPASTAQLVDVVLPFYCKYNPPDVPCLPGLAKVLVYQGGSGEANVVSVTGGREEIRIGDRAAIIEPGPGCTRIDRHGVRCSEPEIGVQRVFIATAGGADTVRSELDTLSSGFLGEVIVNGGHGDDLLVGGPGADSLYAGQGDDVVRGRGGDDRLYDAYPPRLVRSGDPSPFWVDEGGIALANPGRGRDSFVGGGGRGDSVSYAQRSEGVRVDLANTAAISGAGGERDSVKGVEGAFGTAHNDRLAGNRRSNWLIGDDGDDRIAGRAGNDSLEGGNGRDALLGGPGDEQMAFGRADEAPDRGSCGSGEDRMFDQAPSDFLNDDCEQLFFDTFGERLIGDAGEVRSLLPLRAGRPPTVLSATLFCYPFDAHAPCPLGLELRVHGPATRHGTAPPRGTLLGSTYQVFSLNEEKSVSLDVSPTGLELLRRHRALRVSVSATGEPPYGPAGYLTVLRTP
jgi:RTX calcium-binding nonapeptide repeat (4 copies)